ncbi:MAG TPA: deoxyguanosinetriphosphate triphosphohydrolase [Dictyoglomaceae bacterium]|nr:deoxyguanosinetriphosphate triphosphohydrolase [Dictyoglomaceae bacterium]HOL38914.1 deoxyguanosinetriphosphate triphosphohydrolase [Dictyoglomaceae bacterium]HOP94898.1 deoxyguanosinetriphosphate triphosphohydrolase [Dictyoglomaceae bacterium]HPP15669.1 deoxyguanosinetriphosphate triphosphohydrolase [Dictyoglomaceae bacterium]HPU43385.1 deoxyguanosinetriphosphate triphosphohydrolase [Dictyoglomaceae bacterium]
MKMLVREKIEEREKYFLSPFATLSSNSKGRALPEEECPIRTCFQRDRDRIIHSKAFRRLKHKTQVFVAPEGDHYRTRLTHTLEVSQIARTIARALSLNEDLTEAIALGHDLGHTPFGHMGEDILDEISKSYGAPGFSHAEQSLRVVDKLERDGMGLNLTYEVRQGILQHSKGQKDLRVCFSERVCDTLEAEIVRISDVIAYLNHDLDDALRAGVIKEESIPKKVVKVLGETHRERINSMVQNLVYNSLNSENLKFEYEVLDAMEELRNFLYETLYVNPQVKSENERVKLLLTGLFEYFMKNPRKLSPNLPKEDNIIIRIRDFLAGMTDSYAIELYESIFIPKPWRSF